VATPREYFEKDASRNLRRMLHAPVFRRLSRSAFELLEHRKFNVFRLAEKTISENAWSRIFAWLLNSTQDHELAVRPFQTWLQGGLREHLRVKGLKTKLGAVLASTQFPTEAGRYIDILIRVLDKRSVIIAVIGIENKVWSGEQAYQVADYQADLDKRFTCPKILVFLTPEGRKPFTANDDLQSCPCIAQSYSSLLDLCDRLTHVDTANPNLINFLKQMKSYLATEIATAREAKEMVRRLYADKKHRAALRLISKYKPSMLEVFAELKEHVENALRKRRPYIEHWWWPTRGGRPYDVRLIPTKLETLTSRGSSPFAVNYIFTCDQDEPDIGDTFKLIVAAWCGGGKIRARQKAKQLVLSHEPTSWREGNRRMFLTLWVGSEYRLKDIGKADAKALSLLVIDAIDQTYADFFKKVKRMRA
jgi:PD-(D/E)XK nuclease superfamily